MPDYQALFPSDLYAFIYTFNLHKIDYTRENFLIHRVYDTIDNIKHLKNLYV